MKIYIVSTETYFDCDEDHTQDFVGKTFFTDIYTAHKAMVDDIYGEERNAKLDGDGEYFSRKVKKMSGFASVGGVWRKFYNIVELNG